MLEKLKSSVGRLLGFDAVEEIGKRKLRRISFKSEDNELEPALRRRQLVSNARDLIRNSAAAAWAVKTHVSAVTNLSFHSRTGISALDSRVEELIKWWGRPQNCDVRYRHSFSEITRLLEERAVVDGDVGVLKMADGHVQCIEGDRIANLSVSAPNDMTAYDFSKFYYGVEVDDGGKPINYCICKRLFNSLEFERIVPAWQMAFHAYTNRFDQIRGVTPLAPSVTAFADAYEAVGFSLAKMKQSAMYGLSIFRESSTDLGTEVDGEYNIDLSKGPFVLDMDPGDRLEWIESKTPSTEFQKFYKEVVALALKSLCIPACAFNDGEANYAEIRAKLQMWQIFVESRRDVLRQTLNNLIAWRLGLFIKDGFLKLPRGFTIDHLAWEFVGAALPALNPLDEVRAATAAIAAGITSPQRVCKANGDDAGEILAELAQWNRDREALGVAAPLYGVIGTVETPVTDITPVQKSNSKGTP